VGNYYLKFKQYKMPNIQELTDLTTQVRRDILRMVHKVNSGHPGGSLGCTEFFVSLYQEILETKAGFDMDTDWMEVERTLLAIGEK
jgi:transketolase N-terminal domain/subunit